MAQYENYPLQYDWADLGNGSQLENIEHFNYTDALSAHGWTGAGKVKHPYQTTVIKCTIGSVRSGDVCTGSFSDMAEIRYDTKPFGFLSEDGSKIKIRLNISAAAGASSSGGIRITFRSDNRSTGNATIFEPRWDEQRQRLEEVLTGQTHCGMQNGSIRINQDIFYNYTFEMNFTNQSADIYVNETFFMCHLLFTEKASGSGGDTLNVTSMAQIESSFSQWMLDFIEWEEAPPDDLEILEINPVQVVENVDLVAGELKQVRVRIGKKSVPRGEVVKWDFFAKLSSDTLGEALANNWYVALDPIIINNVSSQWLFFAF